MSGLLSSIRRVPAMMSCAAKSSHCCGPMSKREALSKSWHLKPLRRSARSPALPYSPRWQQRLYHVSQSNNNSITQKRLS